MGRKGTWPSDNGKQWQHLVSLVSLVTLGIYEWTENTVVCSDPLVKVAICCSVRNILERDRSSEEITGHH